MDYPMFILSNQKEESICIQRVKYDIAKSNDFFWFYFSAKVSSRPGCTGRCDGYVLEGKELEFYIRKMKTKKGK